MVLAPGLGLKDELEEVQYVDEPVFYDAQDASEGANEASRGLASYNQVRKFADCLYTPPVICQNFRPPTFLFPSSSGPVGPSFVRGPMKSSDAVEVNF